MNTTNVPPHRPARVAASALCLLLLATGVAGCGGNAEEERLRQDELARAETEGRRQAKIEERTRRAEKDAVDLKKQVDSLRRQNSRRRPSVSTGGGGATSSTPLSSGSRSCGGGLSANSSTSCPFAENVRSEYFSSGRSSTIEVFSPVTGQVYTMRCTNGSTTVCSGGNNAAVYFS